MRITDQGPGNNPLMKVWYETIDGVSSLNQQTTCGLRADVAFTKLGALTNSASIRRLGVSNVALTDQEVSNLIALLKADSV